MCHLLGILGDERLNLPFLKPSMSACDVSNPTSFFVLAILLPLSADNMPSVLCSAEQKIPSACLSLSSMPKRCRLSFFCCRAGVAILEDQLDIGKRLDRFKEARLPLTRAW